MKSAHAPRKKDFQKWHDKKAYLHGKEHRVFFHEREKGEMPLYEFNSLKAKIRHLLA